MLKKGRERLIHIFFEIAGKILYALRIFPALHFTCIQDKR